MKRRYLGLLAVACVAGGLVVAVRQRRAAEAERQRSPLALTIPGAMVLIPGGKFRLGDDGGFKDEHPAHEVTVPSFYLDLTEVTVAAYSACVRKDACEPAGTVAVWRDQSPKERELANSLCNGDRPDRQDHPVNCVSWWQADIYCRWIGRRLPTEAEWAYAGHGGDEQRTFAWGNEPPTARLMNACGTECAPVMTRIRTWSPLYPESDGWVGTAPVGSFPAGNARWGLVDMSGNVQEWSSSAYCPYPTTQCDSDERVARGPGYLGNHLPKMRLERRNKDIMWHRSGDLGFRCARTP
jgi:formylglycine-generating enzyme required for sulfatase activity